MGEWIEYLEIMRGDVVCPSNLVVSHLPTWKDWQNVHATRMPNAIKEYDMAAHEYLLDFMLTWSSANTRESGDPCLGTAEASDASRSLLVSRLLSDGVRDGVQLMRML